MYVWKEVKFNLQFTWNGYIFYKNTLPISVKDLSQGNTQRIQTSLHVFKTSDSKKTFVINPP